MPVTRETWKRAGIITGDFADYWRGFRVRKSTMTPEEVSLVRVGAF